MTYAPWATLFAVALAGCGTCDHARTGGVSLRTTSWHKLGDAKHLVSVCTARTCGAYFVTSFSDPAAAPTCTRLDPEGPSTWTCSATEPGGVTFASTVVPDDTETTVDLYLTVLTNGTRQSSQTSVGTSVSKDCDVDVRRADGVLSL